MNHLLGKSLAVTAVSGLLAGLTGCGGTNGQPSDPNASPATTNQPVAPTAAAEKNGRGAASGEKHGCSSAHKHDEKEADKPASTATSGPAPK